MNTEETLEQHFPTPVLLRSHTGIDELTNGLLRVMETASQSEANAASSADNTTQGGYQSADGERFLDRDDAAIRTLKGQIIWPAIESYLSQVLHCDPTFTPVSISSWAVSLGAGDWQAPHFHPKEYNIISGVYYVWVPDAPEPEGCLEFINPNLNAVSIGNQPSRHCTSPERTGDFVPPLLHALCSPASQQSDMSSPLMCDSTPNECDHTAVIVKNLHRTGYGARGLAC